MKLKERIQQKAVELGFEGVGFIGIDPFDMVRGMSAWALGRLGGERAKGALENK